MSEDDKNVLCNFVGQYWDLFQQHCAETGDDPNRIYEELGGEPE